MTLTNAPLLGTKRDEQLFVDRVAERSKLSRNIEMHWNTLILGPAGIGKTSLLNRFAADLDHRVEADPESRHRPLAFQVTGRPESPSDFFLALTARMIERLEEDGRTATVLQVAHHALEQLRAAGVATVISGSQPERDSTAGLLGTLRMVRSVVGDLRTAGFDVVFLVDEPLSPEIAHTIFGRLRDELWTLGATWIVAGRSSDVGVLLNPPADTFFEQRLELSPFQPAEAAELLRARLQSDTQIELSDDQLDQIVQVSHGHPLALISTLLAVVSGTSVSELAEGSQQMIASLERLSAPGRRLARIIFERAEPVRTTDASLLRQMGWTASRLRQVLHELTDAGILEVVPGRAKQPGRPSKVYVPVLATRSGPRRVPLAVAMKLFGDGQEHSDDDPGDLRL